MGDKTARLLLESVAQEDHHKSQSLGHCERQLANLSRAPCFQPQHRELERGERGIVGGGRGPR
jgi:hypothetical protein